MTLDRTTRRIKDLIAARGRATREIAALVRAARAAHFPGHDADWLAWLRRECGIGRRQAYRYARIAAWLDELSATPGTPVVPHEALDAEKLELLAAIPVERLAEFLAKLGDDKALAVLEREELRIKVDRFLGRPFIPERIFPRLPSPTQLMLALDDGRSIRRINHAREWDYSCAFRSRSVGAALARADHTFLQQAYQAALDEIENLKGRLLSHCIEIPHPGRKSLPRRRP